MAVAVAMTMAAQDVTEEVEDGTTQAPEQTQRSPKDFAKILNTMSSTTDRTDQQIK